MLIDLQKSARRHRMKIRGIIHIGAHHGQEFSTYIRISNGAVVFVEPGKEAFNILCDKMKGWENVLLFNCACGAVRNKKIMYTETKNGGQSNSLLSPKLHLDHYPEITFDSVQEVDVFPVDELSIKHEKYNMLVMDVQGYELEVLKGATETLKHIDYIYTEVNTQELYEGCVLMSELTKYLSDFRRIEIRLTKEGWGDAIYKRFRR